MDHQQYGADDEGATPGGGQCRQTMLDNPARFAIEHALRHFCDDPQLRVGQIRSNAELEDLWAIDKRSLRRGIHQLRNIQRMVAIIFSRTAGSILSQLRDGSNRCLAFIGSMCAPICRRMPQGISTDWPNHAYVSQCPGYHWYMSGIVLRPELIGGRAVRVLLSHGLKSLLTSVQIDFPCQLLALAHSRQGEALLEGFNFFKLQNAGAMPDKVPLFCLQIPDRDHLVASRY